MKLGRVGHSHPDSFVICPSSGPAELFRRHHYPLKCTSGEKWNAAGNKTAPTLILSSEEWICVAASIAAQTELKQWKPRGNEEPYWNRSLVRKTPGKEAHAKNQN